MFSKKLFVFIFIRTYSLHVVHDIHTYVMDAERVPHTHLHRYNWVSICFGSGPLWPLFPLASLNPSKQLIYHKSLKVKNCLWLLLNLKDLTAVFFAIILAASTTDSWRYMPEVGRLHCFLELDLLCDFTNVCCFMFVYLYLRVKLLEKQNGNRCYWPLNSICAVLKVLIFISVFSSELYLSYETFAAYYFFFIFHMFIYLLAVKNH